MLTSSGSRRITFPGSSPLLHGMYLNSTSSTSARSHPSCFPLPVLLQRPAFSYNAGRFHYLANLFISDPPAYRVFLRLLTKNTSSPRITTADPAKIPAYRPIGVSSPVRTLFCVGGVSGLSGFSGVSGFSGITGSHGGSVRAFVITTVSSEWSPLSITLVLSTDAV